MTDRPQWLPKVEDYSLAKIENEGETDILRGDTAAHLLRTKIFPRVRDPVRVLDIGIGRQADPIYCPYEPYVIAAAMEGAGKDYEMTLVDPNPRVLQDVRERAQIFVSNERLDQTPKTREVWERFLADTQQVDRDIHTPTQDLRFLPYAKSVSEIIISDSLRNTLPRLYLYRKQPIPPSLFPS